MNRKTIFLICLIVYLIIIFSVEFGYRNILYEKSVEYIEKIDQGGFYHYFFFFFSVVYMIAICSVGIFITLFFQPLNIFFCHLSILMLSVFIMCIFKSIYANSRPYWDIYLKWKNEHLPLPKPTECDGEFGNPSGHAVINVYSLYVWHLLMSSDFINRIESNLKKNLVKGVTLLITILFMIGVVYSRIHRQVHSFNQIIHGSLIGLGMFFLICYIFEYNKYNLIDFSNLLDRYKFIIIPILIVLYILSVVFGLTIHNSKEAEYTELLKEICNYDEGKMFGKNTALISSIIFIQIGGYLGILYLRYKINKSNNKIIENIIKKWNKGKVLHIIGIALFSFALPSVLLLPFVLIPDSLYVLKFILFLICNLFYGFLSFGPCFCFISEKLKKSEIEEKQSLINAEYSDNNDEV